MTLLNGKTAVVYGAAGHIGATVARAFAQEGARVFATGRTLAKVRKVADEIIAAGGFAEAAEVDALDKGSIEAHLEDVVSKTGGIDISLNATSIQGHLQGTPLVEMTLENFTAPIVVGASTHFLTATAAARHMMKQGSGVILTLSSTGAELSGRDQMFHSTGGFGVACSTIESLSRTLAGQLGPKGIRVVCLRSDAIPETWSTAPEHAEMTAKFKTYMENGTVLGRMPTLAEVANAAVFAASDRASAMTGAIVNLSCGSIMD